MPQAPRLLVDEAPRITALDAEPVLRNLLITQCYHDLSNELARVLGGENANWCTFATWASKTAGSFIRNDEVPAAFRGVLEDSSGYRKGVRQITTGLARIHPDGLPSEFDLLAVAERTVGLVSGQITAGNLKVFAELGPVFARFIHLFDRGQLDTRAADDLVESLRVGPSSQGGQSLLRDAVLHFIAAAKEDNPRLKAERMFIANAQTGLHEQIRLQPYIAGSLDAPIQTTLMRVWSDQVVASAHPGVLDRVHALWDRLGASLTRDAEAAWNLFSARELMTLALPGQVLRLGERLTPVPGKSLYPDDLADPSDPQAVELLEFYDALDPKAEGDVGASNWSSLAQRMRYILALFRSRQQEPTLQGQPFTDAQHAQLLLGQVPPPPL